MENGNKKNIKKIILIIVGVSILLAAAGVGVYFYHQSKITKSNSEKNNNISKLEKDKVDPSEESSDSEKRHSTGRVGGARNMAYAAVVRDIQQAIIMRNYNSLTSYMEPAVDTVMAASEVGGNLSPQQAADTMKYLDAATGSWSFDVPESTLGQWRTSSYGKMIPASDSGVIGLTTDGYIVAVTINNSNKITKVLIGTENAINL